MHDGSIGKPTNNHAPSCAGLVTMAERELAAFVGAVAELFGPSRPGSRQKSGCMHRYRCIACVDQQVAIDEQSLLRFRRV